MERVYIRGKYVARQNELEKRGFIIQDKSKKILKDKKESSNTQKKLEETSLVLGMIATLLPHSSQN